MAARSAHNVFLPNKLSAMFWVWRIDLLTLPVLRGRSRRRHLRRAGSCGARRWRWPSSSWRGRIRTRRVLLSVLNAFTTATLFAITRIVRGRACGDASRRGRQFGLHRRPQWSSVQSERHLGLLRSEQRGRVSARRRRIRRGHPWSLRSESCCGCRRAWLLLWVLNLGRLTLVFWAGQQFGEHFAINVLHPYIGLVLFVLGVVVMILCIRPMGLRIGTPARAARGTPPSEERPLGHDVDPGTSWPCPRSTSR